METVYCMKCKKKVEIDNPERVDVKGKGDTTQPAVTGKCPDCGTKVFKFVKKEN